MLSLCHDHGHVSQGQGRDDDDGGERGEEDMQEGRGQGARPGDTARFVSTLQYWIHLVIYVFEVLFTVIIIGL